jgi:dipeptidyl aminopeptidase/acylaminoacyl peptidase
MARIFTCALLFLLAGAPVGLGARPLSIDDMARIVGLEEPAISPDGRTIALLVDRQNMARATDDASLLLIDARDGRTVATIAAHDPSVPRWSPDGRELGFLASASGTRQAFTYTRGTTVQRTHAAADVIDFAWSPDGRSLAFAATDVAANAAALARHHDYFFGGNNDYTATALTSAVHLWTVALRGGAAHRITSGSWTIAPTDPGGIFSPQIAWSRDGKSITLTRVASTFSGEDEFTTLWTVDVATRVLTKLTQHPSFELSPSFSPDGRRFAYWWPRGGDFTAENTIRIRGGGTDAVLAPAFDRNIGGAIWYPDSQRMLMCATDGTATLAWTVDMHDRMQPFALGDLNMVCDTYQSSTFDAGIAASIASDDTVAFLGDDARHARELYVLRPGASRPQQLTHFNDALASIDVGRMTDLAWNSSDGFHEHAVVTYPPGYERTRALDPSKQFPAVVLIHGGPGLSNIREFSWDQWPLAQEIAARGYVVLQPNYRGSDNIGNAFMLAIDGDSAAGPGRDVMEALAALEKSNPIDARRIGVSGWSYGGLLTTWVIGHSHDFRAAVSGAAVNDEFEEYNLSTSNVQDRYLLKAAPYTGDGWRVYSEQSPITYYKDIVTPTLIWGTTSDPVVPVPQAYALYHALTDNHVPVKLLLFPASTHGPSNPVQTADLTRFWLAWLDEYLGPDH